MAEAHGEEKLESCDAGSRWEALAGACDYLACGFHLVPNLELAELLGCAIEAGSVTVDEFQQTTVTNVYSAGETTGIGGLKLSLVEGEIAGLAAAGKHEAARELFPIRAEAAEVCRLVESHFCFAR